MSNALRFVARVNVKLASLSSSNELVAATIPTHLPVKSFRPSSYTSANVTAGRRLTFPSINFERGCSTSSNGDSN